MLPLAFCSVCTGTHMDPNVCVHVVHTCMTVCLKDFLCLTGYMYCSKVPVPVPTMYLNCYWTLTPYFRLPGTYLEPDSRLLRANKFALFLSLGSGSGLISVVFSTFRKTS